MNNKITENTILGNEVTRVQCAKSHPTYKFETAIQTPKCKLCENDGHQRVAEKFCCKCKDALCPSCATKHISLERFAGHSIKDIKESNRSSKAVNFEMEETNLRKSSNERKTSSEKKKPCCEPCDNDGQKKEATCYCENCDENMCSGCLEFHNRQPDNEDHSISKIGEKAVIYMCAICTKAKKENQASCYCTDCSNPLPLCDACAKMHLNMKKTRHHKISNDIGALNKRITTMEADDRSVLKKENLVTYLGKPCALETKSDEIVLQWSSTIQLKETEVYDIMFKEHTTGKWKPYAPKSPCTKPKTTVYGLKPDTSYVFRVRIWDESAGKEGSVTPDSDQIATKKSPAIHVLQKCEKIDHGPPSVYRLNIKENVTARNETAKTRKFILGGPQKNIITQERTIMIVGATGCGKSTLINAMANYIMGVTWEDPFRFTIINLEACEKERVGKEALSQTEWVTCYTIHSSISDRIDYTVNIIDTPGFGDTRGFEQDKIIVDQIRKLFTTKGEEGVATLDAVCFILKAPDARLTPTQHYIFESILALFGKDIKDNICTLITFADGQQPPVLSALQAMEGAPLPYQTFFTFNNSGLYVDNRDGFANMLSPFFWQMGMHSCKLFFDHVKTLQTRSLTLTSEVLLMRHDLENTISNLQNEIGLGLIKINILEKEIRIFTENADTIQENKDFEYEVEEVEQEFIDLKGKGQYTTTCLKCNYTCHENCVYADNKDKAKCCAMNKEGKCKACPKSCHWEEHKNTPYIIKWFTKKVKKRWEDMKKKYEEATQKKLSQEQILDRMGDEVSLIEGQVQVMVALITKLTNRLTEIALRPDPLSIVDYIELMIKSEEREKKAGYHERIDSLEKCKQKAKIGESVQIFTDRLQQTRKQISPDKAADELLKDDKESITSKLKKFFGLKTN